MQIYELIITIYKHADLSYFTVKCVYQNDTYACSSLIITFKKGRMYRSNGIPSVKTKNS